MRLAEGRLTGIQLIKTTLGRNGSPEPHFETDDERTWFSVMLYLHPAFSYEVPPVEALGSGSALKVLTELLHKALKADDQDDHQDNHQDNHQDESEELVGMMVQMLLFCIERERTREELLAHIGLKRYTQTVRRYLVPLEAIGWLEMTIPDKPNSRNQKYRLSAKALDAMQKAESQQ
jgi:ATP-dependent DNA helicase RecG